MNKLFAIAFTCIYLLLTVGVVKTTHYCMGRAKSAEIFSFEAKKCPCGQFIPENSGCCHDEHEIIKIVDDQSSTSFSVITVPVLVELGDIFTVDVDKIGLTSFKHTNNRNTDYLIPPKPIFKLNCSYVFYDDQA
ncbi:MAG: hypothetical protein KF803_08855 [Cyclobacteriaceae bacterium]|nr:hypothetical protein [Cyclobacteriaceae bacterium]